MSVILFCYYYLLIYLLVVHSQIAQLFSLFDTLFCKELIHDLNYF